MPDSSSESTENEVRPDVAAAAAQMRLKSGAKRELRFVSEYLEPDETVLRMARGRRKNETGLLTLTDRRVMFLWKGMIRESHESIPLDLITGVALKKGFGTSRIKTQGAQSMEEIIGVQNDDAAALVEALRGLLNRRGGVSKEVASPTHSVLPAEEKEDLIAKIKQLKELLDMGAISETEYSDKKNELLSRF